jgi:hypothetical protein
VSKIHFTKTLSVSFHPGASVNNRAGIQLRHSHHSRAIKSMTMSRLAKTLQMRGTAYWHQSISTRSRRHTFPNQTSFALMNSNGTQNQIVKKR